MKSFLLILVLCTALSYAWPVLQNTEEATEKDTQLIEKYLDSDYPQEEPIPVSRSQFNNVSAEQIQQKQDYFGLEATHKLDLDTLDVMKRSSCGVSDLQANSNGNWKRKWYHTDLTYRFVNYTPDMARADVEEAFERAFKLWSDVTPLTFKEVFNTSADIMISFLPEDHGDYFDDCPFNEHVLAHAFYPTFSSELAGDIHLDESEHWTKTTGENNLYIVAAHEIGHSLGAPHSNNQQALMYNRYNSETARLHQDDIDVIQALYGHPEDGHHWQIYQSSPGKLLAELTAQDLCNEISLNAVTTYKGRILFFSGKEFIEKNLGNGKIKIRTISDQWKPLRCGVDAIYEAKGILYIFKGTKYWTFKQYDLQKNSPKSIHSLGFQNSLKRIDAAVYIQEKKTVLFFSGGNYWSYSPSTKSLSSPKNIADRFHEIGKVDAAFQYKGRLYLIETPIQYEFDSRTYRFIEMKNVNTWFGCQG